MPKQNKKKKQKVHKNHGIHFVLVNYPWAWSVPWSVADKPSDTLLEKIPLPAASSFLVKSGALCLLSSSVVGSRLI